MAQLDWLVHPPPGTAFHIAVDGTLRLRFDSSQAGGLKKWAQEWTMLFEHYTGMREHGAPLDMGPMPKTLEEINALVDRLNNHNKRARGEREDLPTQALDAVPTLEDTPPIMMTAPATIPAPVTVEHAPSLKQCPSCLGVMNEPDEPVCSTCKGAGVVHA